VAGLSSEITTTTTTEIRARAIEVAQSPKDVTSSAGIVKNLTTILMIVGSCRTRRKGMELTNRKIMMVMVRLPLSPVRVRLLLLLVMMVVVVLMEIA
jgi:hypothetical protein